MDVVALNTLNSGPTRNDKDRTSRELHEVGVAVDGPAFLQTNAGLHHVFNNDNQVNHMRFAWMRILSCTRLLAASAVKSLEPVFSISSQMKAHPCDSRDSEKPSATQKLQGRHQVAT